MTAYTFQNVVIDSYALHLPEYETSSAEVEDGLSDLFERLKIPFGTLEKLSGIKTRRLWDRSVAPSTVATEAGKMALSRSSISKDQIGALISCSVTRDYFEPATSAMVHGNLELPENTMSFDISNACIGFSNGLLTVANMIEQGTIQAGLVVSGESPGCMIETSLKLIREKEDLSRDEFLKLLPVFTLGCGSAAMVLCHKDLCEHGHKIVGAVGRTASQHNRLCEGNGDYVVLQSQGYGPLMYTESGTLIAEAAKLGRRTWEDFETALEWSRDSIDRIFCHQVGRQVNEAFYKEETLDMSKEYTVYQRYGNMVSVALPSALITCAEEEGIEKGQRVLMTAYGSGLNSIFLGLEW